MSTAHTSDLANSAGRGRRTAVITGASRGLGREVARLLAGQGTGLVLTARGEVGLREAADELGALTEVVWLPGDVADRAHAERLVELGLGRFGQIDALLNNASSIGPSPMPTLDRYPLDALAELFRVNVLAPLP